MMPPRGGGGRGGGGRGGGGRGGGGRGGGGRGGGGSRSGGGGGSIKSSNSGKNGPSNKQATTTTTTTTRWPNLFWPFLNFKFTPSPTKRVITTPAPVRETTPAPYFPPTPEFPPTPDFQPTTDENWIANLFRNMKNTTTETPAMTSMTTTMSAITNPYRGNGISSIGNSFKNESTDISSLQKDSQYSIFNNTDVIAAISVLTTLILVSIIIAIYLWRRQKVAKADSKENLFPYQAEAAYSTQDKQLQTISGLVGACYAKENDYRRLENDANKKFEKENNYKQKIVWSISKQSEKDVDPPYADYNIVFSGKV